MALKVWLPLNGNLENRGISGSTIDYVGGTQLTNTNGKIGECYTFSGSTGISIAQQILPSQTPAWSFACWFSLSNNTSTAAACLFSERTGGNSNGYTIFIYPNNSSMLIDDGARWTVTPMTFSAGVWYHLAVTRDTSGKKIYVNGELKSSTTTVGNTTAVNTNGCLVGLAQSSTALSTGNQGFIGSLNDVRIYDHCLSPKEVKEISQGLFLHYKLDEVVGNNLLSNSFEASGQDEDGYMVKAYNLTQNLVDGETYTITAKLTASSEKKAWGVWVGGGSYIAGNMWTISKTTDIYTKTFTANANMADKTFINVYVSNNNGTQGSTAVTGTSHIHWIKIEEGSVSSGWGPSSAEVTPYIPDSSGYGNDGIAVNSPQIVFDENSRYNICTQFNGSNTYINAGTAAKVKDAITIAWWGYMDSWSSYTRAISCTEGGGWNFEPSSGKLNFAMGTGASSNTYKSCTSNTTLASLSAGWHHFVGTYDGLVSNLYIDGILDKTLECYSTKTPIYYHASNSILVGAEVGGGSTPAGNYFDGKLSDIRIYATALSAEDVAKLYNNPANVDNLNGIHGFEMVEDIASRELLAIPYTTSYTSNNIFATNYNSNGELYFTDNGSAGSNYIKINPDGKTYYYDMELSIASGNQFYVGFERYDVNKTARSNQACVYVYSTKPTTNVTHQRYFGTVNLATDTVNPTDTIRLRILNKWSGSDSGTAGTATVHYLSLREVSTGSLSTGKIKKQGQVYTDEFIERDKQASIYENGIIGGSKIIEK